MTCPDCGGTLIVKPELLSCKACGFTETDPSAPGTGLPADLHPDQYPADQRQRPGDVA